jgi:hypothetical protein
VNRNKRKQDYTVNIGEYCPPNIVTVYYKSRLVPCEFYEIKISNFMNTSSTNGILLHVTKSKTVSFQNNFYIRAANVWNTLPGFIRHTTTSLTTLKCNLMKYYVKLTQQIYDPEDPRTFKSVCIKCHTTRRLMNLLTRTCC